MDEEWAASFLKRLFLRGTSTGWYWKGFGLDRHPDLKAMVVRQTKKGLLFMARSRMRGWKSRGKRTEESGRDRHSVSV